MSGDPMPDRHLDLRDKLAWMVETRGYAVEPVTQVDDPLDPRPGYTFSVGFEATWGHAEVGLWGLAPRDLAHCFPEFRPRGDGCKNADCSHTHEPGCAVLGAVAAGAIDPGRHESYRVLLAELQSAPADWE